MALASLSSHRLRDACVEGIAEKEETALLIEGRSLIIIESFLCRKRADVQCGGGGGAPAKYLAAGKSLMCAFSARMATRFQRLGTFGLTLRPNVSGVWKLLTRSPCDELLNTRPADASVDML